MANVLCWMHPVLYRSSAGILHCRFYTSDGKLHDRQCKWSRKYNTWVFRFRCTTWIATRTPAAIIC